MKRIILFFIMFMFLCSCEGVKTTDAINKCSEMKAIERCDCISLMAHDASYPSIVLREAYSCLRTLYAEEHLVKAEK